MNTVAVIQTTNSYNLLR